MGELHEIPCDECRVRIPEWLLTAVTAFGVRLVCEACLADLADAEAENEAHTASECCRDAGCRACLLGG